MFQSTLLIKVTYTSNGSFLYSQQIDPNSFLKSLHDVEGLDNIVMGVENHIFHYLPFAWQAQCWSNYKATQVI